MQDMGAGGVLCSSLEVVQRGRKFTGKNLGCCVEVNKIPCKYQMDDCDKLISESQERMLLVVKPENKEKVFKIFKKWDLEYSVIGKVDNTGYYKVIKEDNTVLYKKKIDTFSDPIKEWKEIKQVLSENDLKFYNDEMLWNSYDSTIGSRTIINNRIRKNNGIGTNFSILNIHEINKEIIITWGCNFDECFETLVKHNFKPLGLVNCLNYGHPKDSIGEMKNFLEDLTKKCIKEGVPVLGGNVSLYNATGDISINPSPVIVMLGLQI
jgi:phosphoribosylformylglycinamidine synthase